MKADKMPQTPGTGIKVRFKNLAVDNDRLRGELLNAIDKTLRNGQLVLGQEVGQLEEALASHCARKFCIGVNSGTNALFLALKAYGITAGNEVITTSLSWIATANAITLTGATPVFADIDDDLNIDTAAIEQLLTPKTKAILAVNFTGKMCAWEKLQKIAAEKKLLLFEDAAQSFGSYYHGRPSGCFGEASCLSLNPMKNLASYGEAGAVLTDDPEIARKLRSLRYGGTINKEDCHWPSINGRIDTLQAAMILVNLKYFSDKLATIRALAKSYDRLLAGIVTCPVEEPHTVHSYYSYTIMTERRDGLMAYLREKGIETKIQHPIPMPLHTAYRDKFSGNIPKTRHLVKTILCLPCHDKMVQEDVTFVCGCIRQYMESGI